MEWTTIPEGGEEKRVERRRIRMIMKEGKGGEASKALLSGN